MVRRASVGERKREHMEIALTAASQGARSPGWEDVHLVSTSLPILGVDDIDIRTSFLGYPLRAPIIIAGMTGGHSDATEVNGVLAEAAEHFGLAMGVGSQRAGLIDRSLTSSYSVVRDRAPSTLVVGNVGVSQLVSRAGRRAFGADEVGTMVDMVRAGALAVHLNALEEMVQTEGDRMSGGFLEAVATAVELSPVPVVAKETGCGMDRESAASLAGVGAAAIDVGGVGGTSFARIEAIRAQDAGDVRGARLGQTFSDWGIPTAAAIMEVRDSRLPLIATGGLRSGLDAAKALALGADLVGFGRPLLAAAQQGLGCLLAEIQHLLDELRLAMLLSGAEDIAALRRRRPVLTGFTRQWVVQRALE